MDDLHNQVPKPIETRYKGYRFRSRLEARWAVFLDAIHMEWNYEKEGYNIDGTWYLPDFWVPYEPEQHRGCGEWVEIKALPLTDHETNLLAGLVRMTGHRAYAICGQPWPNEHKIYVFQHHRLGHPTRIPLISSGQIIEVNLHRGTKFEEVGLIDFQISSPGGTIGFCSSVDIQEGDLDRAFRTARGARFEHGESPNLKLRPKIRWQD